MSCPDCKDGFYYPLLRKREPCRTCFSHSDADIDPVTWPKGIQGFENLSTIGEMPDDSANHYRRTLFGQLGDFSPLITFVSHKLIDTIRCSVFSRENNRIYPLMQEIKRHLERFAEEDIYSRIDISLNNSNFFNIWYSDQQAWETGVYLNIVGHLGGRA